MKRYLYPIGAILCLAMAFGLGYWLSDRRTGTADRILTTHANSGIGKLQATLQLIDNYYVDSLSTDSLVQSLIPELMTKLDPHSSYLTAEQRAKEREQMEGYFYGVGITFNTILDTLVVIQTFPDGPSDIAGIHPGDRITHVDGRSVEGQKVPNDTIMSLLRGPNHSHVSVTVRRPSTGQVLTLKVKRGVVNVDQVAASFITPDSLGVIQLNSFAHNTHRDFLQAYAKLRQRGAKGLVIDLRDNPGGALQAAILVANEFLERDDMIIYTEGHHTEREEVRCDGRGSLRDFPTYVLVNENSASASEVLSGALQDNDAAIIVGRRTFGKGLVQRIFEFRDDSSIHLTIARYYTPSGRSIQRSYALGEGGAYIRRDRESRINSGELFHRDSIATDHSHTYTTIGGRPVYGGGGIIPDIFVPQDTLGYNSYSYEVLRKGILVEFAFVYADKHRELLTKLGDADKCLEFLQRQGLVWQMARYANSKGIRPKNYLIHKAERLLSSYLYTFVIDYIYGKDASARVAAAYDPMFGTVSRLVGEGVYSPFDISEHDRVLPEMLIGSDSTVMYTDITSSEVDGAD